LTTLTCKFGGTSVGTAAAMSRAAAVVLEQRRRWDRIAVVVSALAGVTDSLIRGATTAADGDGQTYPVIEVDLRRLHDEIIDSLFAADGERAGLQARVHRYLDDYTLFCRSVHVLGELTPRAMDAISSLGELMSACILASLLTQHGAQCEMLDAAELIVTDDRFGMASPLMETTCQKVSERLAPVLARGAIAVVTGYRAATKEGITSTLGRGGSDFSASIVGHCLDADEVWIMTDVDGVMTTDPRWVPTARVIPFLSYSEVAELAYFGAKVLHPRTMRPAVDKGIPLWVKNTFSSDCAGTLIGPSGQSTDGAVKAVTAIPGLSMLTVEGRGMLGVPGIAARTFSAVASQGASVLMISQASSEQSICFLIRSESVPAVISAIERELALELSRRDVDRVWSRDGVVIVTAVGAGMRNTPGIAARIFGALGAADINVIAIAQGSSECSVSLVVSGAEAANAVRCIHEGVIAGG
jgi:aspartokinase/homoserine dehydrogenase 1